MQCGTLRWNVRVTRLPVRAHKERLMSKNRIGRAPDREFWLFATLTARLYQNRYYWACLTRIYSLGAFPVRSENFINLLVLVPFDFHRCYALRAECARLK